MDSDVNKDFPTVRTLGKYWERDNSRKDVRLKSKIDALLQRQGKKASQVYKKVGIDPADWSRIIWGIIVPNISQQVKIAQELECDSAVLWSDYPFTDDELKRNLEGKNDN